ncbi:MAG: YggT family protein [Acidimicrobiales bacterium]
MRIVCFVLEAFTIIVVVRMVVSFFPLRPGGVWTKVNSQLFTVTEPVMSPLRRNIPMLRLGAGSLDVTPLIVIVVLQILIATIC